jgi:hypothetical protein
MLKIAYSSEDLPRIVLQEKAVKATKQKEEKREKPKPEEPEGIPQRQHCPPYFKASRRKKTP